VTKFSGIIVAIEKLGSELSELRAVMDQERRLPKRLSFSPALKL